MNPKSTTQLLSSSYDRADCKIGIAHIGPGFFHRAHQAYYVDAMMEKTKDLSWGIAGVNLRAADSEALQKLKNTDDGYVLKSASGSGKIEYRLVRSLIAFADWSEDAATAEQLLALPSLKMITMTVTESGYYFDENGHLNESHPIIQAEIAGSAGTSIYAYLRAGLNRRRLQNVGPVSVLCCDNLRSNGFMLQRSFRAYLEACGDHQLLDWLNKNTSFPSSMVDRITPRPKPSLLEEITTKFGRENDACILSEDYVQWVIEDDFIAEKPPLDQIGVQIVESLEHYEETKIRVLNGGHTCLVFFGVLRGYQTYDEAIADPVLAEHFNAYQNDEVLKTLPPNLPFDKNTYLEMITSRFRNPNVADSLRRICADSVSKMQIFILPTVIDTFEQGRIPQKAITSIASWYVFAKRIHDGDMAFDYIEPNMALLEPLLSDSRLSDFIQAKSLWGDLPQKYPEFSSLLGQEIERLNHQYSAETAGVRHAAITSDAS